MGKYSMIFHTWSMFQIVTNVHCGCFFFCTYESKDSDLKKHTLPEICHRKMDGWKMNFPFEGSMGGISEQFLGVIFLGGQR